MTNNALRWGTYLALVTACISGVNTFLVKIAVTGIKDPILFTTLKNGIVGVLLLGALVALKKLPEIEQLTKRQWMQLITIGIIGGAVPFALFFKGLMMTSAVNGALIHKTLFLWVLLIGAFFLKERLSRLQWAGVLALFAANLMIGGFLGFTFNAGEGMILLATILWAVENIIAKKALRDISSSVLAAARMVFGAVVLLPIMFFSSDIHTITTLTATHWVWIIVTSVLLFGYVTTWYAALKRAPVTYVATILVSGALVTNVLSAIFVTHAFTGRDALSATLHIAGIALFLGFAKRSTAVASPVAGSLQ